MLLIISNFLHHFKYLVFSISFLYPPTPVKHVSKIWPGNSFQPLYILIFGVNIGSNLTISQFHMYVCVCMHICMYGKLIQLLFLRLSYIVDYDTSYLSPLPFLTHFAVYVKMLYFVAALYFLMCTNEIRSGNMSVLKTVKLLVCTPFPITTTAIYSILRFRNHT